MPSGVCIWFLAASSSLLPRAHSKGSPTTVRALGTVSQSACPPLPGQSLRTVFQTNGQVSVTTASAGDLGRGQSAVPDRGDGPGARGPSSHSQTQQAGLVFVPLLSLRHRSGCASCGKHKQAARFLDRPPASPRARTSVTGSGKRAGTVLRSSDTRCPAGPPAPVRCAPRWRCVPLVSAPIRLPTRSDRLVPAAVERVAGHVCAHVPTLSLALVTRGRRRGARVATRPLCWVPTLAERALLPEPFSRWAFAAIERLFCRLNGRGR